MNRFFVILLVSALLSAEAGAMAAKADNFYGVDRDENGVWWFSSPKGVRFLSLGVSDIPPGPTREEYDTANPGYAAFRFYSSTEVWAQDVRSNLQRWGFNTVGAWGHPLLATADFPECHVLHWGGELQVPWCDIFADQFREQVESFALRDVAPRKTDARLLGWFLDNELQWYADTIFCFHLHQNRPTATHQKLVEMLRKHYKNNFEAFRADFDPGAATGFDALGRKGRVYLKPEGHGYSAVNEFVFAVAEHYYRTMHDAIRQYDPNHLILGDRYMSYCPPVVAKAAGPYVDVISTNFDWPDWNTGELPTYFLRMLHEQSGKPVLVTEWYVAAKENRSGNRNTGENFTKVETQSERAETAERRIDTLLKEPYVVGAHWFRYADEPTNGRLGDGEDFDFGLVDIDNRPYEKLVKAMNRANQGASELHATPVERSPEATAVRHYIGPLQFPACVQWFTPLAAVSPSPLADLRLAWDGGHVYVGLVGFRYVEQKMFKGETIPPSLRRKLSVRIGSSTFVLQVPSNGISDQQAELAVVETHHRHRGVRFTYLVTIPGEKIAGFDQLRHGASLPFQASLDDPGDGLTQWKSAMVLAADGIGRIEKAVNKSADLGESGNKDSLRRSSKFLEYRPTITGLGLQLGWGFREICSDCHVSL
jgi:hypothetical protein